MKIYLATDHAGFEMKEEVKFFLELENDEILKEIESKRGLVISDLEIVDCGAYQYMEGDDYPKYISLAAGRLSADVYTGDKESVAVIFGGSGEGEAMVADKYTGLRAGIVNSENMEIVKLLREHNNANVISFGARFLSVEFVKEAVKTFLCTKFEEKNIIGEGDVEESRHVRRVREIAEIEGELNTKMTTEEIEELKELSSLRQQLQDN